MLKKTITFDDLDGNPVTEDFYFNLNKAEIAELELSAEGGLSAHLKKIIESEDGQAVIEKFKEIIRLSVGRRSEDGRRFIKNDEIADEFMQTNAYSELFMELVTDAEAATAFISGVIPGDLREKVDAGEPVTDLKAVENDWPRKDDEVPAWIEENRDPTAQELQSMTKGQMAQALQMREARNRE